METKCTKCDSVNVKLIITEIDNKKYKCLNCNNEFSRKPTFEERSEFNS